MRVSLTQPSKGVKDRRCPDCPTNPGVPRLLQLVAMWSRTREDSVRTGGGGRAEGLQSSPRPPVWLALRAGCRGKPVSPARPGALEVRVSKGGSWWSPMLLGNPGKHRRLLKHPSKTRRAKPRSTATRTPVSSVAREPRGALCGKAPG